MSTTLSFGDPLPASESATSRQSKTPFHVLVLGDFGGRRGDGSFRMRPVEFDRDNLEDLMVRLGVGVRLQLAPDAPLVEVPFAEIDDFHPDRLFERLELFEALRTTRRRLKNPKTYDAAVAEIQGTAGQPSDSGKEAPPPEAVDPATLFEQTLERTEARAKPLEQRIVEGRIDWNQYAREIVEPYVVARPDPRQAEYIASVDEAVSESMRRLLHHPDFQRIESAWRGLHFLSRRIETDVRLKLFLLNVNRTELSVDLRAGDDLRESQLYRVLVDEALGVPGINPWSLILGSDTFDNTDSDVESLGRLARILAAAGAPLIAGGSPRILGCPELHVRPDPAEWESMEPEREEAWRTLRAMPESRFLCLALPRILSRQPYGVRSSPIEAFAFEETGSGCSHEDYLWTNPAFGIGSLLAQAFSRGGWNLRSAMNTEIENLPVHVFEEDGETRMTPCAETVLDASTAEAMVARGLVPVHALPGRDVVRIPRIHSLSSSDPPLAGPWE